MWLSLTYVDSPAVALHQQQRKHVQGNQVDDKHVASPRRHLRETHTETESVSVLQHVGQQLRSNPRKLGNHAKHANRDTSHGL